MTFEKTYQVRWADVDMNAHMRHSAFNDYAAQLRVDLFSEYGIDINLFHRLNIGPVIFREETHFFKELYLNEKFSVHGEVAAQSKDYKKWSIRHVFYKTNGDIAADITVDGAWMDLKKRKVSPPPEEIQQKLKNFPLAKDFKWI